METAVYFLNPSASPADTLAIGEDFPYERLYFGSESCDRLLPAPAEVSEIARAASSAGVATTFVTPVDVGDDALGALVRLLNFIAGETAIDEIVFNDWGVLEVLGDEPRLTPVMGRALTRMKRDPRVDGAELRGAEARVLRSTNLTNPAYARFLEAKGVRRAELDNVPQGLSPGTVEAAVDLSLYYPTMPVAFLKHCVIGAAHREGRARYALEGPCRRECRQYRFAMPRLGVSMIERATYMTLDSLDPAALAPFDRVVRVIT